MDNIFPSPPTGFGRVSILERYDPLWFASRKWHTAGVDPHTNRKPLTVAPQLSWRQSTGLIHLNVMYSGLQVLPVLSKRYLLAVNQMDMWGKSEGWRKYFIEMRTTRKGGTVRFDFYSICLWKQRLDFPGLLLIKTGFFSQVTISFTWLCQCLRQQTTTGQYWREDFDLWRNKALQKHSKNFSILHPTLTGAWMREKHTVDSSLHHLT